MATSKNQPPDINFGDQLQSIQANLFSSTDRYKELNKQAGVYNSFSRDNLKNTTELNKLITKSLDISSKIGKELVKQKATRNLIKELESKVGRLQDSYQSTLRKLSKSQKDQITLLKEQQDNVEVLGDKFDSLDIEHLKSLGQQEDLFNHMLVLEKQGLNNSKEFVDLERELESILKSTTALKEQKVKAGKELDDVNKAINKTYKEESLSTALLKREQVEAAEKSLAVAKALPKEIDKGNKSFQHRNFLTEAFSNVPILKNFKKLPKLMEDFGAKGVFALGAIGLIGVSIAKIVELMFKADRQITDIQKGFSVSRVQAEGIRQSFYSISANAGKFADIQKGTLINQEDIFAAQMEYNKAFGTAIVMSAQQLTQLAAAKDLIGLSEESMKGLMTYSLGSGKAIQNIDRTVLGTSRILQAQTGIQLDNKQILEDVYKTSGGIRANFKGNVEQLSKAVTQAKLYGTSLEQIQHTSDSLLDFETSIESQLEAELLTGRQINLERARAAALNGDMVTVMSEMVKQAGDFDHFMRYNVITQNSLAKSFGYTRDEMSDMLFNQKAIEGLRRAGNNEEKKSLTERYAQLVKEGHSREEMEQILGKETEQRLETQSAQERFNKSLQRLEDIFGRLFDGGIIDKAIKGIATVVEHLSSGGSLFGILSNSSSYQAAQKRVSDQIGSVQDGVISPKGAIMISTPKGQIATSPGDSVIATNNPNSLLGGGSGTGGSTKGVEAKLDQVIALLSRGGNVYIDGKKAGTALALGYNATL